MLSELRRGIDAVDEELMRLIGERVRLAAEVGRVKRSLGLPIVDGDREREVIARWVEGLGRFGVDLESAIGIAQSIIGASTRIQLTNKLDIRVTIVGSGRVGRTLAKVLGRVTNVALQRRSEELVPGDIIMLATRPTPDSLDIITKYSGRFRGSVVMDLFSVKAPMFRLIESESLRAGFHYISAHPLFGELGNPIGETVVLIPSKSGSDRIDMTRELFTDAGFKVVVLSSPEEHDRLMAYIQVAHHILLLTLYRAMKRAGLDLDTPLATHSLKYTLKALERILEQPEVSNELFRLNPYSRSVAEELGDLLKEVVKGLNGNDVIGGVGT
ncbi:chorismate mutase [Vulcanisaeta souniana]|uniref:Chorismate mutase n=1 Tax=Vulcanisaeta souniana JCM 11219 TaxID=1293586 RepID=A0A830E613_9CREN|nr:chorismate mutase [Vulcanisaeta souniana]BDR92367.1 chorismate mutase [Vulcanisaeta souniana JCM 11219]GGI75018.1 chorismate mutase [Vulcanisaeta souniana JCM 11219]